MSVQSKCSRGDLLALRNILHGSVVEAADLCNDHLLWTMWRMGDVALCGTLLRCGALPSKVARTTTVEAGVVGGSPAVGGAGRRITGGGGGRALGAVRWC
jgi:hypothetical protein